MSIASRLNLRNAQLKRKLFSNKVKLKGLDVQAIRLQVEEDKYSNKELTVTSHSKIEIVIDFPSKDVLLGNTNRTNNETYLQYQSIYDVLPIYGYLRMDTNFQLEKDDIILFKYLLEPFRQDQVNDYFIQALQVASTFGRFSNTLLYKKYTLAPYNINIDEYPEIKTIIEAYQLEELTI